MSNLKISQLPNFTGTTAGSWLIANNAAESTTFKIQRESFLNGYAQSSDVTSLSSSIAVTDLSQNNRLTSIESVTGSFAPSGNYATTGSNVFKASQVISGSVELAATSYPATSNKYVVKGQNNDTGSLTGVELTFTKDNTTDSGQYNRGGISFNVGTGSYSFTPTHNNFNITSNNKTFNITGSVNISGSFQVTGSANTVICRTGYNIFVASGAGQNSNQLLATDINGGNLIEASSGSNTFRAVNNNFYGQVSVYGTTYLSSSVNIGNNTSITGSLTVTGSIIQTGSVQGNVNALSISSNTASLNLNNGNFFTLQLVSGQATHLNPSNIKPGQTVSVFVNTIGSATMTFPSSIKQISGSAYTPTTGTGIDILTLVSKDTSNLYLVNAKNFI